MTRSFFLVLLASSCGGGLPQVPRGPHLLQGGVEPVAVDSEPPPAEIEQLSSAEPPRDDCYWADGRWSWEDNRWQWQSGGWVKVPDGCYYADPLLVWVPSVSGGVLFYTRGQWYREDGQGTCEAPPTC